MEKGAAKRFCGKPNDTLQSLQIKPFFDSNVIYRFRREDFHPMPRVDAVLLYRNGWIASKRLAMTGEGVNFYPYVETGLPFTGYVKMLFFWDIDACFALASG